MPRKKHIAPGVKLPLRLTAAERKLVLDELIVTGMEYEQLLRSTPAGQPVMMTLDDLDDFGGYIAAEANHCEDKRKAVDRGEKGSQFRGERGPVQRLRDGARSATVDDKGRSRWLHAEVNRGSAMPATWLRWMAA